MLPRELAAKLDQGQYPFDVPEELAKQAKAEGSVVVFGASDDLMEFRGAIHDEIGCYGGGTAYILDGVLLAEDNACESECKWFLAAKKKAIKIEGIWAAGDYSWTYKTKIPYASFEILEDGDKYCLGIVFSLKDLGEL